MTEPGWQRLPECDDVLQWATHASRLARTVLIDPANARWYRCDATWFAGVDCLTNTPAGQLPGGPPFPQSLSRHLPDLPFHPGQLSAVFPGYPAPMEGEPPAAARYRLTRDAAHVDGLLPVGPDRRRMLREPHAYILGIPLNDAPPEASPLVVWEGSHRIMADAFRAALEPHSADHWAEVDLTDIYHAARRRCFEVCPRVEIPARPGEAILLHRLMLHGIAPWRAPDGPPRLMAYFRPEMDIEGWIEG